MACFVDFFRPGLIDWRTPNPADIGLVHKLLGVFAKTQEVRKQAGMIQGLFDLELELRTVAVEATTKLSRRDQDILLDCLTKRLDGEERARWLRNQGFKGFGMSPLAKFRENPHSMRALISKWRRELLYE